jgi:hypothetical protein
LVLVGPARAATVVAATPHAVYLEAADPDGTILCLAAPGAVRVPCALVLEKALPPQPPLGTQAEIGTGNVSIQDSTFRVQRWWRPPRPRGLGAVPPARLGAAVRWLTGRVADPLDAGGRGAVEDLVATLAAGQTPDAPVARLLGRGPGLTPTGDDVLAAALVTLHAFGSPAAPRLADAVRSRAPGATTTVSAALLRHAADGRCIPQLADLLAAIGGTTNHPSIQLSSDRAETLPRAAGALLAVGNCSGAGLLHGVLVAVAIAHERLAHGILARPAAPAIPAALPVPAGLPSPVAA